MFCLAQCEDLKIALNEGEYVGIMQALNDVMSTKVNIPSDLQKLCSDSTFWQQLSPAHFEALICLRWASSGKLPEMFSLKIDIAFAAFLKIQTTKVLTKVYNLTPSFPPPPGGTLMHQKRLVGAR